MPDHTEGNGRAFELGRHDHAIKHLGEAVDDFSATFNDKILGENGVMIRLDRIEQWQKEMRQKPKSNRDNLNTLIAIGALLIAALALWHGK